MSLPTYDALYTFLEAHYRHDKHERFGERNLVHSNDIAHLYMRDLSRRGQAIVSETHSVTGRAIKFDSSLKILETA